MQSQPTPEKSLQTGLAFWASKTLLSAIEIGVFTELAHRAERFETLHARLVFIRVPRAISSTRSCRSVS
jgi:hypothetical protein